MMQPTKELIAGSLLAAAAACTAGGAYMFTHAASLEVQADVEDVAITKEDYRDSAAAYQGYGATALKAAAGLGIPGLGVTAIIIAGNRRRQQLHYRR